MPIKKWGEYNEGLKRFSGTKKTRSEEEFEGKKKKASNQRGASDPYADKVNQDILAGNTSKPKKEFTERIYKTNKQEKTINIKNNQPPEVTNEKKNIKIIGKVAKFPKDVNVSTAYAYMENLKQPKLNKKDIWYLMVEKQNSELQMIKYNQRNSKIDLGAFVNELKRYYIEKYKSNSKLVTYLEQMEIGKDTMGNIYGIRNIPNIKIGEKKLIQIITEDLIKILN